MSSRRDPGPGTRDPAENSGATAGAGAWRRLEGGLVLALLAAASVACGGAQRAGVPVPGRAGAVKTPETVRAERRAFDGAPPVVPHEPFSSPCVECHDREGMAVEDVGFAPPSPHEITAGLSATSHCRQCHVFQRADGVFAANSFEGLRQDLRRGRRLSPLAPPVMPHPRFMRERCLACHGGPAAREVIRTDHPERPRCEQCHVEQRVATTFPRG